MAASLALNMQTIDRAFAVLHALSDHAGTSTLGDIARVTGLPKSTVHRLLAALENQAAVQSIGGRWALGPGLATLTHQASPVSALRELARPHLLELADDIGENASLAIPDGDSALYIDTATVEGAVNVQDWTGERIPYHAAAAGLALMSTWADEEISDYASGDLAVLTEKTVTNAGDLCERAARTRAERVVWTPQEFSEDVNGVGAAIIGPDGRAIGAINVYGPVFRFPADRSRESIEAILIDACARIGSRLG